MKNHYYFLNTEHTKTDAELKSALFTVSQKYNQYADHKLLYIYRSNTKDAPYCSYEVFFGKENFIHLVGFKRNIYNAIQFYEECLAGTISLDKVSFKENRKAASAKLDALPYVLDYKYVKIYKIGDADKITLKNKFEMGLGNDNGIIGFDRRTSNLPIPVTVMKRSIKEYVSNPQNVIAILKKDYNANYYDTIVSCVSKGILLSDLPETIRRKISPSIGEKITNPKP